MVHILVCLLTEAKSEAGNKKPLSQNLKLQKRLADDDLIAVL